MTKGEMSGSGAGKETKERYEQALRSVEESLTKIYTRVADDQRANEFELTFRLSLTATFLAMAISLIPVLWASSWRRFPDWPWPIMSPLLALALLGIANAWWRTSPFRWVATRWLYRKKDTIVEVKKMTTDNMPEMLSKILVNQEGEQIRQKKEQEHRRIFDSLNLLVAIVAIWALGFSMLVMHDTMTEAEQSFWVPIIIVGGFVYVLFAVFLWRWQGRKEKK